MVFDDASSFFTADLVHRDVIPQLKTLVDLVSKVWQSNLQIMSFIANHQASNPSPDLRYTWAQEPIRFEDAMGRVIPVPSEYNWEASRSLSHTMVMFYSYVLGQKLEAIITAQFNNGPGYKKICAGEYELFNTLDSSQIISRAESELLTPGLSVTMAIVIWQYHSGKTNRCPRPGCRSDKFTSNESGGRTWYVLPAVCNLFKFVLVANSTAKVASVELLLTSLKAFYRFLYDLLTSPSVIIAIEHKV